MRAYPLVASILACLAVVSSSGAQPRRGAAGAGAASGAASGPAAGAAAVDAKPALTDLRARAGKAEYDEVDKRVAGITGADLPDAKLIQVRTLIERGKYDDATKAIAVAKTKPALRAASTLLEAELLMERGSLPQAERLLTALRTETGEIGRAVRVKLGELLIAQGRREDANDPLQEVIDDYRDMQPNDATGLAQVAKAAHLLRSARDANRAFTESEKADKGRVDTLLARATVFLEKYDTGHAEEVLRDVLKLAPKRADALALMARIKLEQALDFDAAEELCNKALEINPVHRAALAVLAGVALQDMDIARADALVDRGLAANPNDLELLSIRAATRFLADDQPGFVKAKAEVFARNKQFAEFYLIVGEFLEWEHRYDDIVSMMTEATKLDPDEGRAWAVLGFTHTRTGNDTEAMTALNRAWSKDKFNVRVFNTLNLFEKTIVPFYETKDYGAFKIRYEKSDMAVLERYVPQLVGDAYGSMKSRYGFVPQGPLQVELYGSREHFSVRTSGLPRIGIQGVCFGKVVAAMSPASEPANWGGVLWHEIGHVFAIQLSKNHVPRWFTEGLSEYETIAKRPEWQRTLDPQLYVALKANSLPSALKMNRAFTHAEGGLDVVVAYYAASQMMLYTVEQFGLGKVRAALAAWGEGLPTDAVLKRAFGVTVAEYDAGFRAWALGRLRRFDGQFIAPSKPESTEKTKARAELEPKSAAAQAAYGLSLIAERKLSEATKVLEAALKLEPGQPLAHYLLARVVGPKKPAAALVHLDAMRAAGHDGYAVQILAAQLYDAGSEKDKAANREKMRFALEAARRFDPKESEPLKGLYDMALEDKRPDEALAVLRDLAPLEQHDPKIWGKLLEHAVEAKNFEEGRRVGEAVINLDVHSRRAHVLYAESLLALSMRDAAVYEADSALLCAGKAADEKRAHEMLAQIYTERRDLKLAKEHTDAAALAGTKAAKEAEKIGAGKDKPKHGNDDDED